MVALSKCYNDYYCRMFCACMCVFVCECGSVSLCRFDCLDLSRIPGIQMRSSKGIQDVIEYVRVNEKEILRHLMPVVYSKKHLKMYQQKYQTNSYVSLWMCLCVCVCLFACVQMCKSDNDTNKFPSVQSVQMYIIMSIFANTNRIWCLNDENEQFSKQIFTLFLLSSTEDLSEIIWNDMIHVLLKLPFFLSDVNGNRVEWSGCCFCASPSLPPSLSLCVCLYDKNSYSNNSECV